ncbi:hypothetical protein ACKKBG_A02575 [Auxenochlorella protothecoides x Auxenochlorella symbiontica]|uniref:Histone deacetylase complex subunit SAP30 Sin3 binding domain-containing protein n=1 Tax=Auxenochlorella protothecoides TaxID=3075 RepID=A0A087SJK4_AUXPR|nr:hypothetical protein F751_4160 [Auxenochlorella protothecoides]KFM25908.1 hypothetical protein F751_4160 [Auxenochlorella protothecoides]RMZ52270.1 hypothetical protein APUTEX25_001660 [Auxenochlorella protothecoides]|eukprot:RMZ52270.1 hypothetical protein APUTEX25_001660 [Auxenochlorella protothecoides]
MAAVQKGARSRPVRTTAANVARYSADYPKDVSNGYSYKEDQYIGGSADGTAPRVDLTKLKVHALRKYTKVYEVPGIGPQSSKEDLTSAVSKHWNTMTVSEESVLQNLMRVRGRH